MISINVNEKNTVTPSRCPHCQESTFIKHGFFKEIQRYRCKSCGKTFCPRTNSPWYYSKKSNSHWIEFWRLFTNKTSLEKSSKILKINIATAFNWRHKILNAIEFLTEPECLYDTVSITKRIITENHKGPFSPAFKKTNKIWYVIAADSNDNVLTAPFCLNIWNKNAFKEVVFDKIEEFTCIMSFGDSYIYNATKKQSPNGDNDCIDDDWIDYIPSTESNIKDIVLKTFASFNEILTKACGISTKYIKHYLAFAKSITLEETFTSSLLEMSYPTNVYLKCCDIKKINTFN